LECCRRRRLVLLAAYPPSRDAMPDKDPCEVYMRYLPRSCTEAALREKFEKCGRITRVWLSVDRATGECKGFGFVTFSSKTEARRCVKDYNEHPRNYMDGKHVVITHAQGWDDGRKPVQMCSFGASCARQDCYFRHPEGWDPLNPAPPAERGAAEANGDGDGDGDGDDAEGGGKRPRAEGGEGDAGDPAAKKPKKQFKERKKTASRRHKLGAKARKRAKAREAKVAAEGGGD
jgi:cold-inducible RNA-binding protein